MTDSMENKVARFLAKPAVKAASKLVKCLYRIETPRLAEHFNAAEREKAALFIIKLYGLVPVRIAAKHNVDVYVVGVEYKMALPISPWIPFLTKIVVRFEKYEPKGKGAEQITREIREKMAELSGLEGKLETEQPLAAAGGTINKSPARYN